MPSYASAMYKDSAGQRSTVQFTTRDMDAANHDTLKTEWGALRTALEPFTLGHLNSWQIIAERAQVSQGSAAGSAARRELKLLLTYEDTVTNVLYNHEIPAPEITNDSLFASEDKEYVDTSTAEWTALKTAFEAFVRSPDLNTVTLHSGKVVGRNL